jgi:hypothetical protein
MSNRELKKTKQNKNIAKLCNNLNERSWNQLKIQQETYIPSRIIRARIEFDTRSPILRLHALDLVDQVWRKPYDHGEGERVIPSNEAEGLFRGGWARAAASGNGCRAGAASAEGEAACGTWAWAGWAVRRR